MNLNRDYIYTQRQIITIMHNYNYVMPIQNTIIINPQHACTARVTVVVPCIYVGVCVRSNLPPHTLESQERYIPMASSQYGNHFKS